MFEETDEDITLQQGSGGGSTDKNELPFCGVTKPLIRISNVKDCAIQVVSDVHIEFYGSLEKIPRDMIIPRAPILALLGDIGIAFTNLLRDFLYEQAERFDHVLFVAGNHEFYNTHGKTTANHRQQRYTIPEQVQWLQQVCDAKHNLHFLEHSVVEIGNVRVLGTTLWTHVPFRVQSLADRTMNDYRICYQSKSTASSGNDDTNDDTTLYQNSTVNYTNTWHQSSVEFLQGQLAQAGRDKHSTIVLTHHTPLMAGTSAPQHTGGDLNHCFSTNLPSLLQEADVWACGHTHYNFDKTIGPSKSTTRLVSNQRGYWGSECMDYDPDGVVLLVDQPSK